jgi:hypothetical protein
VVEGARLESVYSPKGYRGFESLPLCYKPRLQLAGAVSYFSGDGLGDNSKNWLSLFFPGVPIPACSSCKFSYPFFFTFNIHLLASAGFAGFRAG